MNIILNLIRYSVGSYLTLVTAVFLMIAGALFIEDTIMVSPTNWFNLFLGTLMIVSVFPVCIVGFAITYWNKISEILKQKSSDRV